MIWCWNRINLNQAANSELREKSAWTLPHCNRLKAVCKYNIYNQGSNTYNNSNSKLHRKTVVLTTSKKDYARTKL